LGKIRKVYEQPEPTDNDKSPTPLNRYKICYFAFDSNRKIIRCCQLLYAHDLSEAKKKAGIDLDLIYETQQLN
jgi:hypothetical protein